jgi:glutaminyl-tRNA synthetase
LFSVADPERGADGKTFLDYLNPASLEVVRGCQAEPRLATAEVPARFQFERLGYFCVDADSKPGALVFNRTVSLRDSWAKIEQRRQ